jgi:hypothetical protein
MSVATILALLAAVVGFGAAAFWYWASNTGNDFLGLGTEGATDNSRTGYRFLGTRRGMDKAASRNKIAAGLTAASALISLCSAMASWHGTCPN